MNYLYRDLVHSKIGLTLESGQKTGENRALTRLHTLTGDSHAPAHFPTRRAYARSTRAVRGQRGQRRVSSPSERRLTPQIFWA